MATVRADMSICNRTATISVDDNADGTFSLKIESDCTEIQKYAHILGNTITMDDIIDIESSKILSPSNIRVLTATCLVPNAIMNAAFLEAGLISKSSVDKVKENHVEFVD